MTPIEYKNIQRQIREIEGLMPCYSGKTLDNVLSQLKSRVKEEDRMMNVEIERMRFA